MVSSRVAFPYCNNEKYRFELQARRYRVERNFQEPINNVDGHSPREKGYFDMINVIATIQVKKGRLAEFVEIFKSNIPSVLKEKGCIEYKLTVDYLPALPFQEADENAATVIEKWEDVDALQAHLSAPHMTAYREKVKGWVESSSIKVLKDA